MHFAFSTTSCGMPLSGAPITSFKTSPALVSRSRASSLAVPAQLRVEATSATVRISTFFISQLSSAIVEDRNQLEEQHARRVRSGKGNPVLEREKISLECAGWKANRRSKYLHRKRQPRRLTLPATARRAAPA